MARGLTPKVRRLVKGMAAGKKQKVAAKEAGLNEQYASDVLKKPEVRATLVNLMDKAGLSDKNLLSVHKEMLGASKTVSIVPKKGETEGRDATESSVEFVDVPDWQARGKALEMGYKLKGAFIERHEVSAPGGGPIEYAIKEFPEEALRAIASRSRRGVGTPLPD